MAGVTAAATSGEGAITDALKSQAVQEQIEQLYRNDEVMREFQMRPFTGGSTINVKMHYAGNTSVSTYSEGDAIGQAGAQSYITAQWPEAHYKCVVQITGHARDFTKDGSNSAVFYDQAGQEIQRGMVDIVHQISLDMLSTGTTAPVGLQGIVDSTGTLAGLSKSTYTWWASYETAGSSTTITVADLNSGLASAADPPYAARISAFWTSWKQKGKHANVIGNAGAANSPIQIQVGNGTPSINMPSTTDISYHGGVPIKPKSNLTNSIWLGLTESDFFIGVSRDITVALLGKTDDSDKYLITCGYGLGCMAPRRSFKLTTYTD